MPLTPGLSLKRAVGRCERKVTIAIAESCTGGLISSLITDAPGSSVYFIGTVVAYHNDVKTAILGVKAATLKKHGAVSAQTAIEMAVGVKKRLKSQISVSVTGIAGPGGGSKEKPVGTVFIALCAKGKARTRLFRFKGNRLSIKKQSALKALEILKEALKP